VEDCLSPLGKQENFAPLLEDEAQRARTLYIEGAVRQIWHRGDEPNGALRQSPISANEVWMNP
jgi:hypothetical protein